MTRTVLFLCAALFSAAALAQDPGAFSRDRRGFGGGPRRGMEGGGMMMPMRDNRGSAEEELLKKFPEDMAALQKERAAVEEKMQALAGKAEVKLPDADFTVRRKWADFRKKYEKELNEISELRKTDPRASMQKMRELMQKEGISMPGMGGGDMMRGGPGMRPDDNAPADPPARADMRQQMEEKCKAAYPEEYAEYEKLRKTDPRAADRKLREMLRKNNTGK